MMVKHTISIYDMVCEYAEGANFEFEKWEEKIKDHIIYLINLYCYLDETENVPVAFACNDTSAWSET